MIEFLESALRFIVSFCQIGLELIGIVVLAVAGVRSLIHYLQGKEDIRLEFARKISLALEFFMAGEILHTVVAEDWEELIVLGAIIVFRAVLTWEIGKEEKELEEKSLAKKSMAKNTED